MKIQTKRVKVPKSVRDGLIFTLSHIDTHEAPVTVKTLRGYCNYMKSWALQTKELVELEKNDEVYVFFRSILKKIGRGHNQLAIAFYD